MRRLAVLFVVLLAAAAEAQDAKSVLEAARPAAVRIIMEAAQSPDAWTRAEAIDAMQWAPDRALPLAQLGLSDSSAPVRYIALMVIGRQKLSDLGPAAAKLLDDPSAYVRAAALYAATATGQTAELTGPRVGNMLGSGNPLVLSNIAYALGMMGNRSAIPLLQEMGSASMRRNATPAQQRMTRARIAEALVRLGEEQLMDVIRSMLFSDQIELRVAALNLLADLNDQSMLPALPPMIQEGPVEVAVAAATAMLRMGNDQGLGTLHEAAGFSAGQVQQRTSAALRMTPADSSGTERMQQVLQDPQMQEELAATVRAQAAYGLGFARDGASARLLTTLLHDPSPTVRLAASAAVLRGLARR